MSEKDTRMHLSAQFAPLAEIQADWLIVGAWEEEALNGAVGRLDGSLGGTLSRLREAGDIRGKANEITTLLDPRGIAARRVLVVGLGPRAKAAPETIAGAAAAAGLAITGKAYARLALALPENASGLTWEQLTLAAGVGLAQGCQGPGLRKTKPERFPPQELWLAAPSSAPAEEVRRAVRRAEVEARAVLLARELVNTPPCDLYPESFAERARQAAQNAGVEIEVLDGQQLEAERMGSLLAVARGSDRPPRLVILRYRRGGSGQTLGLVGKGVTFDSGGLSLKTTEQMVDMKCDMAGAAAVLAAVTALAELQAPINVLGVLPLVENLPSGRSMKLGDVLHARNGKTIEVLNTDAEGRLILADALAYAVDQKVDHLVDLATLTGACVVALGTEVAGAMSNDDAWAERVLAAARRAGERVWPLPMYPLYRDMIKSPVADMKNTGGSRYGGAISAAKFLEEFVGGVPWVHLDIAGPAWVEQEAPTRERGGTGYGVRSLVELGHGYSQKG
jgi:leucyl aminopeptidase